MIELDPRSPVPLYRQIAVQIRRLIALGALQPGDRLPAVRELAVKVRVNRNTAARAIQHLEAEGLVRSRVGQGTFVEQGATTLDRGKCEAAIDASMDSLLIEAHTMGMPLEDLGGRLTRRIERFREGQRVARNPGDDRGEEGRR